MAENADESANAGHEKKGPVDWVLSIFADVQPGEGITALVLLINVLLLLVAYYVLKTVREPLIIASGGAQLKGIATAVQAVLLMGFVPLYALLTARFKRMQLITMTMIFYAAGFALFWLLAQLNVPYLGFAFFLFLGIFALSVIAQFWSMANDLYTPAQGKRLFAILGIGSSVGAVAGSYLAKALVKPLGPYPMMLVASAILMVCLGLSWYANAREAAAAARATKKADDKPIGGQNGFALIVKDRYLLLVAAVILMLNLVNTTGELILDTNLEKRARELFAPDLTAEQFQDALKGKPDPEGCQVTIQPGYKCELKREDKTEKKYAEGETVEQGDCNSCLQAQTETFIGVWRGDFFFWVNLFGAVMQLFLVSRIFKYLGIRAALFSLPIIGLFAYGVMAFFPLLALIRIGKIAENATDYSLYNTTKQALWLPTTREQKYNAKMAIDTFIVRAGDFISGVGVAFAIGLGFGGQTFAIVNLVMIAIWLVIVVIIGRENQKRTDAATAAEAAKPAT